LYDIELVIAVAAYRTADNLLQGLALAFDVPLQNFSK
jgi:hypothetical protein